MVCIYDVYDIYIYDTGNSLGSVSTYNLVCDIRIVKGLNIVLKQKKVMELYNLKESIL